jgi:2,3-bisphosphoglycerate-independent phosphoglycerate mutase
MEIQNLLKELKRENGSKIVLIVADGLGGLPLLPGGKTELETARTPNLDRLVKNGVTGLITPILPGITTGSGPGHLGLFGYDPLKYRIGRGVLEALGIDFKLRTGDVAVRGNFCTIGDNGKVKDRRAGRISSDEGMRLVKKLQNIRVEDIEIHVEAVREHRLIVVFRGLDLSAALNDTDPQVEGVLPFEVEGNDEKSSRTAKAVSSFLMQTKKILSNEKQANMVLLRGFSSLGPIPSMSDLYGVQACAIAYYPMYKGVARLIGMSIAEFEGGWEKEINVLKESWNKYSFFFLHFKGSDTAGEDGDFDKKVAQIEFFDGQIAAIAEMKPDVLVITGDHSTPSKLGQHSWHPVPVMLVSNSCRPDDVVSFGERACTLGGLGHFESKYLMSIILGHAGRLTKFGA